MLNVVVMVCRTAKGGMREWYPSTIGPLLPTMTDSLLAPGREVRYKRYHTSELVRATILGPSDDGDDFVRSTYACPPLGAYTVGHFIDALLRNRK